MNNRSSIFAALVAAFTTVAAAPAAAAGVVVITQAKALAGNITPGDAPGYPITIGNAGSYRLESNLFPGAGQDGIAINNGFVTVDFNGFSLFGGNKAANGIVAAGPGARIANGTVARFKLDGISGKSSGWSIENMLVTENGDDGIILDGDSIRVHNSTSSHNGADGLDCGFSCNLEGNVVASNGGYDIALDSGTVLGNTIMNNGSYGLFGGHRLGYGNNTIEDNNNGGDQTTGIFIRLFPNACYPTPCP